MIRTIRPGVARGSVRIPGSKSYTHRALALGYGTGASLSIRHALDSEDTRATAAGLGRLGAGIRRGVAAWELRAPRGHPRGRVTIDCRESGTTLRLLTAIAATEARPVRFLGRGRLPSRPIRSLLEPLESLGARVHFERRGRNLPFTIEGPITPGRVRVATDASSQPVSALLIALARLAGDSEIMLAGDTVSRPYIDATVAWMRARGVRVVSRGRRIAVKGPAPRRGGRVEIPVDASSAAYAWAAAACTGGSVRVERFDARLPQADARILEILERMGVRVERHGSGVRAYGSALAGVRVDLTDAPDLVPLVAGIAAGIPRRRSTLRVPANLRHKESDRRAGSVRLVRALGGSVRSDGPFLRIDGAEEVRPIALRDQDDHRMVMSAAIAALRAPSRSRIGRAEAVRKSFPGFWTMLEGLVR